METSPLSVEPIILAIDPGLSGAVCRLSGGTIELRRDFKALPDIARAIQDLSAGVTHAVIENVHAMPGQGVCSMFSFGRSAGVADGALALALPHLIVESISPQKWQNYFRARHGILKGQEFNSRALALHQFPDKADFFKRVKDHNSADAVLLAVWKKLALLSPPA
jgi:crossover junction endodeoxyribonuclease RuvC